MNDSATRQRFIAGAVCPRCGLMDKIIVNLDTDQRECVACGFVEDRPGNTSTVVQAENAGSELPTRVSRPAARRMDTAAEPVRLVEPEKKR